LGLFCKLTSKNVVFRLKYHWFVLHIMQFISPNFILKEGRHFMSLSTVHWQTHLWTPADILAKSSRHGVSWYLCWYLPVCCCSVLLVNFVKFNNRWIYGQSGRNMADNTESVHPLFKVKMETWGAVGRHNRWQRYITMIPPWSVYILQVHYYSIKAPWILFE